jgi:hypothetical protein
MMAEKFLEECNKILHPDAQFAIRRAARLAHIGNPWAAETWRGRAGYKGLPEREFDGPGGFYDNQ